MKYFSKITVLLLFSLTLLVESTFGNAAEDSNDCDSCDSDTTASDDATTTTEETTTAETITTKSEETTAAETTTTKPEETTAAETTTTKPEETTTAETTTTRPEETTAAEKTTPKPKDKESEASKSDNEDDDSTLDSSEEDGMPQIQQFRIGMIPIKHKKGKKKPKSKRKPKSKQEFSFRKLTRKTMVPGTPVILTPPVVGGMSIQTVPGTIGGMHSFRMNYPNSHSMFPVLQQPMMAGFTGRRRHHFNFGSMQRSQSCNKLSCRMR